MNNLKPLREKPTNLKVRDEIYSGFFERDVFFDADCKQAALNKSSIYSIFSPAKNLTLSSVGCSSQADLVSNILPAPQLSRSTSSDQKRDNIDGDKFGVDQSAYRRQHAPYDMFEVESRKFEEREYGEGTEARAKMYRILGTEARARARGEGRFMYRIHGRGPSGRFFDGEDSSLKGRPRDMNAAYKKKSEIKRYEVFNESVDPSSEPALVPTAPTIFDLRVGAIPVEVQRYEIFNESVDPSGEPALVPTAPLIFGRRLGASPVEVERYEVFDESLELGSDGNSPAIVPTALLVDRRVGGGAGGLKNWLRKNVAVKEDDVVLSATSTVGCDKDWNKAWQEALEVPKTSKASTSRWERLSKLSADFKATAENYTRIIVMERNLPDSQKTVKPLSGDSHLGIAGGQKYLVAGGFQC